MRSKNDKNRKARFFANSVEAIFFWLVLGGLLLFIGISLFRYASLKKVIDEYNSWSETLSPMSLEIDTLRFDYAKLDSKFTVIETKVATSPKTEPVKRDSQTDIIVLPDF